MVSNFYIKNPPKRKIPYGRVSRQHHYVMIFPQDLIHENWQSNTKPKNVLILKGLAYINFFDSFLEDCHKRIYKYGNDQIISQGDFGSIFTACLN